MIFVKCLIKSDILYLSVSKLWTIKSLGKLEMVEQKIIKTFADLRRNNPEVSLRWFGHVLRRVGGYIGERLMNIELLGRRKR